MGFLERLENLIQGAIEGSANTVMRQKIKPIEIENRLEREMRDESQPSRGGRIAPNSYTVWLHPETFRETIAGIEGYNRHCEQVLNQFAAQQGYNVLQQRISVAFDTDASMGRKDIHVDATFDSSPLGPGTQSPPPLDNHTRTQLLSPSQPVAQPAASLWRLEIVRGRDMHQQFEIPLGDVTIGRSRDCDIVLRDDHNTVSRQHAMFINQGDKLLVRDVGSKNGTKVNGNFIPHQPGTVVADGTEITFGDCVVRVRKEGW